MDAIDVIKEIKRRMDMHGGAIGRTLVESWCDELTGLLVVDVLRHPDTKLPEVVTSFLSWPLTPGVYSAEKWHGRKRILVHAYRKPNGEIWCSHIADGEDGREYWTPLTPKRPRNFVPCEIVVPTIAAPSPELTQMRLHEKLKALERHIATDDTNLEYFRQLHDIVDRCYMLEKELKKSEKQVQKLQEKQAAALDPGAYVDKCVAELKATLDNLQAEKSI